SDLERVAAIGDGDERDEAAVREVNVGRFRPGLQENVADRDRDSLELEQQPRIVPARHSREQEIWRACFGCGEDGGSLIYQFGEPTDGRRTLAARRPDVVRGLLSRLYALCD